MPAKKEGGRRHKKPPRQSSTSAVLDLSHSHSKIRPELIVYNILTRLPVKPLARFKCVCKPWLDLLSSSKFIAMHRDHTSNNPKYHSFIIHSLDQAYNPDLSLFNINSNDQKPMTLINPFPSIFGHLEVVGSVHGLVCLCCPPFGRMIILWNPALNMSKSVRLSSRQLADNADKVSLGFGYDAAKDDYKIVRISCFKPKGQSPKQALTAQAEVYSVKLDSWKRIPLNFPFIVSEDKSCAIVQGAPYWTGVISESKTECMLVDVLLCYDLQNEVFKNIPKIVSSAHFGTGAQFVEWKGSLASLVHSPSKELQSYIDVFVFDESGSSWKKKSRHGPIALKTKRLVQCSKNGVILAETPEGNLFFYDPETNGTKEFSVDEARRLSYEAVTYTESLICAKGMEQVKKQDKKNYPSIPESLSSTRKQNIGGL